jgi:hypothetical protein
VKILKNTDDVTLSCDLFLTCRREKFIQYYGRRARRGKTALVY